jgi:hypothetical protein
MFSLRLILTFVFLSASKFTYHDETGRKPPVVSRADKPICGLTTTKNFVIANAVENMLAEPKKVESRQVDWLHKEDFGKVPEYLQHVKAQVSAEYEMVRTAHEMHQQTHSGGAKMRLLSEEERTEVLFVFNSSISIYSIRLHLLLFTPLI